MRLLLPFICVAVAIGIFVGYTNPTYQEVKTLIVQADAYDAALAKAKELHAVRDELLHTRDTLPPQDITKLEHLLPDNIDNIRLVIDMNNIASQHGLVLSNVDVGDLSKGKSGAVEGEVNPLGSFDLSFSVQANTYEQFLSFAQDAEHSLRLMNIKHISFTPGASVTTPIAYNVTIETYWLH